jgi:hypothetical protein
MEYLNIIIFEISLNEKNNCMQICGIQIQIQNWFNCVADRCRQMYSSMIGQLILNRIFAILFF